MSIILERFENSPDLVRRYSDQGYLIRQIETGNLYGEAIDLETAPWTYEETDIPAEQPEEEQIPEEEQNLEEEISDSEALDIIFGGEY